METYKVRIKTDGNVKSYTTNTITLAKITRIAGMYELIAPSLGITTDDLQEADKLAKKAINRFFRSVGLVANYIDYTN